MTVGSGYLTIRAERHEKTGGKHRSEFRYGAFSRTIPLPSGASEDDVTASYADGTLTVTIGGIAQQPKPAKKVEIKAD